MTNLLKRIKSSKTSGESQNDYDNPSIIKRLHPALICNVEPDVRPFEWPKRKRKRGNRRTRDTTIQLQLFDKGDSRMDQQINICRMVKPRETIPIFRDNEISLSAKGLLALILDYSSCNPDFKMDDLLSMMKEDWDTINVVVMELISHGYCTSEQIFGPIEGQRFDFHIEKQDTGPEIDFEEDFFGDDEEEGQPMLFAIGPKKEKKKTERIPWKHYSDLYKVCFGVSTNEAVKALSGSSKGRCHNTLVRLRDAGADLNRIFDFELWWKGFWQSKDKESGQYQYPVPEKVTEYWWAAMAVLGPLPDEKSNGSSGEVDTNFVEEVMRTRAEARRSGDD